MIPKIVKYNMGDVFHTLGMKENLSKYNRKLRRRKKIKLGCIKIFICLIKIIHKAKLYAKKTRNMCRQNKNFLFVIYFTNKVLLEVR